MNRTWVTILAIGSLTYLMRASFLAFAHRFTTVPPPVARVLRQIPPAALASMVVPAFVRVDGHLSLWQPRLAAGVLATAVAWRTRSTALTLLVGMVTIMLLEQL